MPSVITEEAAKARARALRTRAQALGIDLKQHQCLELVAATEGEPTWSRLNAKQVTQQRSRDAVPAAVPDPLAYVTKAPRVLDDFDMPYGVAWDVALDDYQIVRAEVQPYGTIGECLNERERVNEGSGRHKVLAVILWKDAKQQWAPMPESAINHARARERGQAIADDFSASEQEPQQ